MNILHIIDSGGLYGAETMLLNLMQEQSSLGLNPSLASIGLPNEPEKPIEAQARIFNLTVYPFRMKPGPNWLGAFKILRHAHHSQVDVLHSHGYKGNILFGYIPLFLRRIPIVTTLHGWTSADDKFSRMWVYENIDAYSLRLMDRVVLVNSAMIHSPKLKKLKSKSIRVIENGYSLQNIERIESIPPDMKVFLEKKSVNILAVGRLSKEKGFSYLIDAFFNVIRKGHDIRLTIFGEGDERAALQSQIADLGLNDHVLLPGFISNVTAYYSLFDALVISSLTEGLPMVLLEAMNTGIPIISTSVGGIPHVLGKGQGGLLVEPANSFALGLALEKMLNNAEENQTRVNWSKRQAKVHYSSRVMATQYLEVYKEVAHA